MYEGQPILPKASKYPNIRYLEQAIIAVFDQDSLHMRSIGVLSALTQRVPM